jgi:3-carboxy-cis,cis-muconate cycloisomerase
MMAFTALPDALFAAPEMWEIWSGEASVRAMLDFEAALAHAEAGAQVIPAEAAEAIAAACHSEQLDVAAVFREATVAGTPAIPLVRLLGERVAASAQAYIHWGATSQDAIDTALVLQMRAGLALLADGLCDLAAACAELAERYRATPMVGRTLLQQAAPITFGLKAARWLALATRQLQHLGQLRARIAVVQLGGAAGTLAALGPAGLEVTERLAGELGLAVPELPWHTERDRVAEVAAGLGVVAGAMAKIAEDIVLLAQTEIAEVSESASAGKGTSSAMPHKRNPIDAVMARAAARLAIGVVPVLLGAMAQEHERAAGAWQAEWAALPSLFCYTSAAVDRVRAAVGGLQVHPDRMEENLTRSGGLVFSEALALALAPHLGRDEAQRLVRAIADRAAVSETDFQQAALADERVRAVLPEDAAARVFEPAGYLGSTDAYIDRALAAFRALDTKRGSHERHRRRRANRRH